MNWRHVLTRLRAAVTPDPEVLAIVDAAERIGTGLSRRAFLRRALASTAVAATCDVDQLLWTPGERRVFIPSVENADDVQEFVITYASSDWFAREAMRILKRNVTLAKSFNREYDDRFTSEQLHVGDVITIRGLSALSPRRRGSA